MALARSAMRSASFGMRRWGGQQRAALATVSSMLEARTAQYPTKDVLRVREVPGEDIGLRWTMSDLNRHSAALGQGLNTLGAAPGDTIAVFLPSNAEHVTLHYAAARSGLVVADVGGTPTAETLAAVLDQTKATALVVEGTREMVNLVRELLPELSHRIVKACC